jgi:6-phosphogluconate dehydrogenase
VAIVKVGIIGLGRMGAGIAERIVNAGYTVFGFDLDPHNSAQAQKIGVHIENKLIDIAADVDVIWLMVPPGKPVDDVLTTLMPALKKECIIIDGGNSNYKDSIRRAQLVAQKNISYLDCGTSGGLHGRENGYCLMVGGDKHAYDAVCPLLSLIAAPNGMAHVGPSGAGHYVKMVHNGIEYALLQGYAEGFQVLKEGTFKDVPLNLEQISDLWNHGSIIRSFLLELAHNVYKQDQEFAAVSGEIAEGGTGKWTVQEAQEHGIPVPLIEESLAVRARSRSTGGNYATKLVALLRNQFGGHAVKKLN